MRNSLSQTSVANADSALSRRDWLLLLGAIFLATVYNLPNFLYPFFEDTALFATIGKWMLRGLMPYRDLADQKTPAIYFTTAFTAATLGTSSIASRIVELVAILVMAAGCGRIAYLLFGRVWPAAVAIAICGALGSPLYWGLPERGEVEIYGASAVAWGIALALAYERRGGLRRLVLSGAFVGLACWYKPHFAIVGLAIAAWLATYLAIKHQWGNITRTGLALLGGALFVSLPILLWMVVCGIGRDFYRVIFQANSAYLDIAPQVELGAAIKSFFPGAMSLPIRHAGVALGVLGILGTATMTVKHRGRDREERNPCGALLIALWWIAALLQYVAGRYLFNYHRLVAIPVWAIALTCGWVIALRVVDALLERALSRALRKIVLVAATITLATLFCLNDKWIGELATTYAWWTHKQTREAVYQDFGAERHYYRFNVQERAAQYIRERTNPGDFVHVIGRAGAFYLMVDRQPASRYLVTSAALNPERRDQAVYHDRLLADLATHRPVYILVRTNDAFPWHGLPSSWQQMQADPQLKELLVRNYDFKGVMGQSFAIFRRKDHA